MGVSMWIFYLRGELKTLDTLMALLFWAGVSDGYLCWKEGVPGKALFRFFSGLVVGGWGFLGLTSRG